MTGTILITGCSTGLGNLTARYFAGRGWNVVATMRVPPSNAAGEFPEGVLVHPLDVTDRASIDAAIAAAVGRFGGLDAVVNNAGVSIVSIFETTSQEAIRRVFDTNVHGVLNVTQAAIPHLRRRGGGAIVNVTSGVGFVAVPLLSLYVASKHAVEGFSESLGYELESQNIRVKLVEPGAMRETSFSASTRDATGRSPVPAAYKAYFDHALGAMIRYPFAATPEQAVVETIYRAATDLTPRLRYPIGPDIDEYARSRWSTSEDEYRAAMASLTGQAVWREKGKPSPGA